MPPHEMPDPRDEDRWTSWIESMLHAAGERIAERQRELRDRGIIDEAGKLAVSTLPADMQPGSKTSVTTG